MSNIGSIMRDVHAQPIVCFQHCRPHGGDDCPPSSTTSAAGKILCFSIPTMCPLCGQDTASSYPVIPPFVLRSPFHDQRSDPAAFHLLLKPTRGTFLHDYTNSTDMHIALTDSRGRTYDYNQKGLNIDQGRVWDQCLAVPLRACDRLSRDERDAFDEVLEDFAGQDSWLAQTYDARYHNCYDFVLEFLRYCGLVNRYPCARNRTDFCREMILPKTVAAAKYISLYRRIRAQKFVLQDWV